MLPLVAFVIGVAGGLRSMSAPAAITWAAYYGWLRLAGTPLAFFALPATRWIFTALAIGEWIADKLPFTPSRKAPLGLSARFISGAQPTTAPITRSTFHFPPNSRARAPS